MVVGWTLDLILSGSELIHPGQGVSLGVLVTREVGQDERELRTGTKGLGEDSGIWQFRGIPDFCGP